jgi:hypothetical protein
LKVGRDKVNSGSWRALVVLKVALVDAEFGRVGLNLRMQRGTRRMVSTMAYEAGGAAGASLAFNRNPGEVTTPYVRANCKIAPAS